MILKHISRMLCLLISYSKFTRTIRGKGLTKPVFLHILFSRNDRIFSKGMEQEKYFSVGRQREAVRSWERLSSEEKEVRL